MHKFIQGLPNKFDIVDDILIAGFDDMSKHHDTTINKVLMIGRYAILKINKGNVCSCVKEYHSSVM